MRGSEEAVAAAYTEIKAIMDEERAANPKAKSGAGDNAAASTSISAPQAPPPFNPRAVPVGGDAAALSELALAKMSKNARRRLRNKQDKVNEPVTWSDGLDIDVDPTPSGSGAAGDDSASDILAALLQRTSVSTTSVGVSNGAAAASSAPAPAVVANGGVKVGKVTAPPPGIAVPVAAAVAVAAAPAAAEPAPRRPPGIPDVAVRRDVDTGSAVAAAAAAVPATAALPSVAPTSAYRAFTVNPFDLLGLTSAPAVARPAAATATAAAGAGNRHVSASYSVRL